MLLQKGFRIIVDLIDCFSLIKLRQMGFIEVDGMFKHFNFTTNLIPLPFYLQSFNLIRKTSLLSQDILFSISEAYCHLLTVYFYIQTFLNQKLNYVHIH